MPYRWPLISQCHLSALCQSFVPNKNPGNASMWPAQGRRIQPIYWEFISVSFIMWEQIYIYTCYIHTYVYIMSVTVWSTESEQTSGWPCNAYCWPVLDILQRRRQLHGTKSWDSCSNSNPIFARKYKFGILWTKSKEFKVLEKTIYYTRYYPTKRYPETCEVLLIQNANSRECDRRTDRQMDELALRDRLNS